LVVQLLICSRVFNKTRACLHVPESSTCGEWASAFLTEVFRTRFSPPRCQQLYAGRNAALDVQEHVASTCVIVTCVHVLYTWILRYM